MHVVEFNFYEHERKLEHLLFLREMDEHHLYELPTIGYLALIKDVPVCAGFLRIVEGGAGMIDALISNPECSGELRHQAIDAVVNKLIAQAKGLGLKQLFAFSVDTGTIERSLRHGFVKLPHTMISLDLKGQK